MKTNLLAVPGTASAKKRFGKRGLLAVASVLFTGIALFAATKTVPNFSFVSKTTTHKSAVLKVKSNPGNKAQVSAAQGAISSPLPPTLSYSSWRYNFNTGVPVSLTATSTDVAPLASVFSGPTVIGSGLTFQQNGVTTDAAGNIYVADIDGGTGVVKKIAADGSSTTTIGSGFLTQSSNTAVDKAGNVYVADQGTVWKIPASGSPVSYGTPVIFNSTFSRPFAIAADTAGNVYVTDLTAGGVYKMAGDGTGKTRIDNGTINNGSGISVDAAGNVYVVDFVALALYKIPADSSPQTTLATGFSFPRGVAVDNAGNIYIDDEGAVSIYMVPPTGGAPVAVISGLTNNVGVAIDGLGNLFVALQPVGGVSKYSPTGGYFINHALPAGLSFDGVTGAITGIPTTISAQQPYIVTAYNSSGSVADTLKIKVGGPLPVLSYTSPSTPYLAGTTITPLAPSANLVDAPGYAVPEVIPANLLLPLGTATDALGNIYVASKGDNLVKKINVTTGTSADIGTGFSSPSGVAVDKNGNVYVADADNGQVKEILASDGSTVLVSGTFNKPIGVAVDDAGNIYVADLGDAAAYKIPAGGGSQITLAADFDDLTGIAVDKHGNIYVSDGAAQSVYRMSVKGGGAVDIGFIFTFPAAVATDAAGNLYVADGNGGIVYKVEGGRGNPVSTGFTYTFAGGVSVDQSGNLFTTDSAQGKLFEVTPSGGYSLQTALPAGLRFNDTTGVVSGKPSAAAAAANYTAMAYNAGGSSSASFNLEVDLPPAPTVSYTTPNNLVAGSPITPLAPTATGVGSPGYNSTPVTVASGFNQPGGTAVDAAGNIYFADSGNNKVMMLPKNGDPAVDLGSGFQFPTGVALDAAGNIYVADQGNGLVKKMPPGGGTPVTIGSGFSGPSAVAVDSGGIVYVADGSDGTVYKILTDGTTTALGGGFFQLTGIAVDGKENLYFTDGGDHAVYKVSLTGGIPFNIGCYFNYPSGIAVDNSGNIYVTDKTDNTLYRITKGGNRQVAIGMGFIAPSGVAVDAMGVVYIGDTGSNSIDKLLPSGGYFISATLPRGLKFSGTSGAISGTPLAVSAAKDYNVTAYSYGGPASATVNIAVTLPPPPTVSYPTPLVYAVGSPIVPVGPTSTGIASPGYSSNLTIAGSGYIFPSSLATDNLGNIYVTDTGNDTLYKIPPGGARVPVGSGFSQPSGVAVDAAGNIYVADSGNGLVKKIQAGSNTPVEIGSGFVFPATLAVDGAGNLYIGDDAGCSCGSGTSKVYKINAKTGVMSTLSVSIGSPGAIAVDGAGNVFVTDLATGYLYKLASGSHSAVRVGNYVFNSPYGLTIDGSGNLFVADAAIGEIDEVPAAGGALVPINAGFIIPYGIALDNSGNLVVSDILTGNIDKIQPGGGYFISPALPAGLSFDGTLGTISGTPTAASPAADYTVTGYNFGSGTPAITNITVLPVKSPLASFIFTPAIVKTAVTGPGDFNYTATVKNTVSTITVTPVTRDATMTVTVNGTPVTSGTASSPITLNVGDNTITTAVTIAGVKTLTYISTITRLPSVNAYAASIIYSPNIAKTAVSGPGFANYTAIVKNTVSSITVTPTTQDATATVTLNGLPVISGAASDPIALTVGTNTITTEITAGDGVTVKDYIVTITREASVNAYASSITYSPNIAKTAVSGPGFANYTATVQNTVTSIAVTPTTQDATAAVTVNGQPVTSGATSDPVTLTVGENVITTEITAGDGVTKKDYIVTVTREKSTNAYLSSLTFNPNIAKTVVAGPGFANYTATVQNTVSSITLTPTTQDATATITINGQPVSSGAASDPITLNVGDNTITTEVTAGDGVTKKTYIATITRQTSNNAYLSSLNFNPNIAKTEVSGPGYANYTASVRNSVSSITVTPLTQDATATVKVGTQTVASGSASSPIALNVGDNTITTTVTAGDGTTTRTYIVTITRAPLTGLAIKYDGPQEQPLSAEVVVHQNVSPNGDGRGDGLVIEGIAAHPDNKLQIMNRSGNLVYEASGYDNATKVFDGHSSTNGKLQQAGTYFYSLVYKEGNEVKHKTGFIVLKY